MARKNEKYSAAEKRAYYRGQGYVAAFNGKKVKCNSKKEEKSFSNGMLSGKGVK